MSSRYAARFELLARKQQKAFVPFTLLGWPNETGSMEIITAMLQAGVSALELGFPFSDPVADGPVIQQAAHQALAGGFKLSTGLRQIKKVRALDADIPIGILIYYNMILAYGIDLFFEVAASSGVDGVLIADLPVEYANEVRPAAQQYGIDLIYLVSPVTTEKRIKSIAAKSSGFIYLVSRLGVTGSSDRDQERDRVLGKVVSNIRECTSVPICAGFGISSPESAQSILSLGTDGVITGSRVLEIAKAAAPQELQADLSSFFTSMINVCTAGQLKVPG